MVKDHSLTVEHMVTRYLLVVKTSPALDSSWRHLPGTKQNQQGLLIEIFVELAKFASHDQDRLHGPHPEIVMELLRELL